MGERSLESIAVDDRQSGGFVSRAVRLHVSFSGSLMLPDIVLGYLVSVKACLHVPSPSPRPSVSPSKFIIVSIEMDRLMDRMGSVPILPVKRTITIDTMLYFDGDGHGDSTCKQAFRL